MRLIRQRYDADCGVAALAMLLDLDYEAAAALLPKPSHVGLQTTRLNSIMASFGYAVRRLKGKRAPFAERHLLEVRCFRGHEPGHFCVMDEAGLVLDPALDLAQRMSDYHLISHINGFYRVGSPV